jgi:hypothetical protein
VSKHFTIQFSYLGKPSNILDNSPAIHGCYHIGDERVALPPTSLTIAQPFMAGPPPENKIKSRQGRKKTNPRAHFENSSAMRMAMCDLRGPPPKTISCASSIPPTQMMDSLQTLPKTANIQNRTVSVILSQKDFLREIILPNLEI